MIDLRPRGESRSSPRSVIEVPSPKTTRRRGHQLRIIKTRRVLQIQRQVATEHIDGKLDLAPSKEAEEMGRWLMLSMEAIGKDPW